MTRYAYLDKNVKSANMRELMYGVKGRHMPVNLFELSDNYIVPADAEMVFVHGVLRGNGAIIRQSINRGIPWVYMDNASAYFPDMYKRVCFNGTAPKFFREGKRFKHGTTFKKWRGGTGKNILVLPPSPPYMDTFYLRNWLNYVAHTVNKYTDRNVVVRAKPAKGKLARPWQEQLDEAYCVITWGSALALDAMRQGVPTISMGDCPAKYASFKLEDLETEQLRNEPLRLETFDNLTWSCFTRDELKLAYKIILENANKSAIHDYYKHEGFILD